MFLFRKKNLVCKTQHFELEMFSRARPNFREKSLILLEFCWDPFFPSLEKINKDGAGRHLFSCELFQVKEDDSLVSNQEGYFKSRRVIPGCLGYIGD